MIFNLACFSFEFVTNGKEYFHHYMTKDNHYNGKEPF